MIPTIGARFRCGFRPLPDFKQLTIMFQTFELQYLNKLSKGEVRDFSAPKTFQVSIKVECLGRDKVKPSAEEGLGFQTV